MSVEKYHPSIRVIHWIMFILFAIIFVLGFVMVEFKESEPWAMYNFHKATGVLVFMFILLRLVSKLLTKTPAPSDDITQGEHRISKGVVHLLYLFMIIVPITGYVMSNLHGHHVEFYGLLQLPDLLSKNVEWKEISSLVHEYMAYAFLAVIALHLLGVIRHHIKGQEVLRRIT